ncbi:MAG TPA: RNA polymerase sigma-70 factor [Parasegetibacter sp.]
MDTGHISESNVISMLTGGSRPQDGFKYIYQKYYSEVVYFASKLVADQPAAEDMATEAFVKLWNNRSRIKSFQHCKSYLFLSVKHDAIDYFRKRKISNGFIERSLQQAPDELDEFTGLVLIESEILHHILTEINTLPRQCSQIVRLILLNGMKTEEVATLMNISSKTVLNQKMTAVKKIRNSLIKKGLLHFFLFFLPLLWEK